MSYATLVTANNRQAAQIAELEADRDRLANVLRELGSDLRVVPWVREIILKALGEEEIRKAARAALSPDRNAKTA